MLSDRFALSSSYRRAMHPAPRSPSRSVVLYRRFAATGRSGYVSSPVFCLHLVTWRWANSAREGLKRLLNTAQCLVPGHILQQSATIRHDCGRTLFSRDMAIFNRTEMQGGCVTFFCLSVSMLVFLPVILSSLHHFFDCLWSLSFPSFILATTSLFYFLYSCLLYLCCSFVISCSCVFFIRFFCLFLSFLLYLCLLSCLNVFLFF